MKEKLPISWKVEEYAFGAAALREEIKRHKKEDKVRWRLTKSVGIRMLWLYATVATFALVILFLLRNTFVKSIKSGKRR